MEPRCFPLLASLLLVPLLFPGLPRAHTLGHAGTEAPSNPQEGSSGQGTNGSLLHHRVKRYLPPRTPPYAEPEPNFKIVDCMRSEGYCQEFCNFMETQVGYCSAKKDACCLHRI
uniref:Beta-defensin-like domain-containing protein n=1 Tax=Chinchilla lanigera TaxID=34839 RepID=A0A8C2W714_CHILA